MRSGSHITHTLYPPCDAFMLSRRESRSLSAPVMMACWFSAPIASIHCSMLK